MTPTQIFQRCLSVVVAESGISEERLLSRSRETDVVDVRNILVYTLHIYNLYTPQIARETGFAPRTVAQMLSGFDNRIKHSRFMGMVLQDVKRALPDLAWR